MIIKDSPEDFRVLEVLKPGTLGDGPFVIYRVTKMKLTTLEAQDLVATEARVEKEAVSFAGLKDRQGITVQYFSVRGGKPVRIQTPALKVVPEGRSSEPLTNESLAGNLFEVVVRSLNLDELAAFRANLEIVKRFGLPNYFDDQRFGCVRHGQGFILRDLMKNNPEAALKKLITGVSPFDKKEEMTQKNFLSRNWGKWDACLFRTKRRSYGKVFEHLSENPSDFTGAFSMIPSKVRLIHLYAYQSYLWNKSVGLFLRELLGESKFVDVMSDIGPLSCTQALDGGMDRRLRAETMPLLDEKTVLEDPAKKRAVESVLKKDGFSLAELKVEGIPGFFFKGEERKVMVYPEFVRAKPPVKDERYRGKKISLRFRLPPGSYATLVLKRFFVTAPARGAREAKPGTKTFSRRSRA